MAKYPISKEFFPFNMFAPPMSRSFVLLAQKGMAGICAFLRTCAQRIWAAHGVLWHKTVRVRSTNCQENLRNSIDKTDERSKI